MIPPTRLEAEQKSGAIWIILKLESALLEIDFPGRLKLMPTDLQLHNSIGSLTRMGNTCNASQWFLTRSVRTTFFLLIITLAGCSRPSMPSLDGVNMFHDITQVRKGMSANEVRRVMGSKYTTLYEEGLEGMDGGNYIWDYTQGRVYFGLDGVTRVAPAK